MSLWNPYAFTPTGQANDPVAPPALRVIGGPATAQQMQMAQHAFAQFCMNSRLSSVPNPVEDGRLPDGTPYKIIDVSGVRTMMMWPARRTTAPHRGVGVTLSRQGEIDLFIVAYKDGRWLVEEVRDFFGGDGLWVSSDGKSYFTDGSQYLPAVAPAYSSRRYSKTQPRLPLSERTTTIRGGVGYEDRNSGIGIITPANNYAQIRAYMDGGGISVGVSDVKVVPESKILESPEIAAAAPSPRVSLGNVGGAGLELVGGYMTSRLRTGDGAFFPVFRSDSISRDWQGLRVNHSANYFSGRHISGEISVTCHPSGDYSADFNGAGVSEHDTTESGELRGWDVTFKWATEESAEVRYLDAVRGELYGTVTPEACGGSDTRVVMSRSFPYALTTNNETRIIEQKLEGDARRLVYLSRGWDDGVVAMVLRKATRVVVSESREAVGRSNRAIHGNINPAFNWRATESSENPPVVGGDIRDLIPTISETASRLTEYKQEEKLHAVLETPWGEVTHKDVDWVFKRAETERDVDGVRLTSTTWSVSGKYRKNHVIHINPLLGVVAYIGVVADGFAVSSASMTVTSGFAELVVLAKGVEIYSSIIGAVNENMPIEIMSVGSGEHGTWQNSIAYMSAPYPAIKEEEFVACTTQEHDGAEIMYHTGYRLIPTTVELRGAFLTREMENHYRIQDASFIPREIIPGNIDLSKHRVLTATDPGSGGGVVMVVDGQQVKSAIAVAPQGSYVDLSSILPSRPGASINPMALSV